MATTKNEYDHLLIEAARSVLLELSRLLSEYQESIVVVGGSVPGLLFDQQKQAHIGTIDIDLALDHNTIQEIGYRSIMELLLKRGYRQSDHPYTFFRSVTISGKEIKVEVDFLAPEYGGTGKKHRTQKVQDMHPRKARGCDLVFLNPVKVMLEGTLPGGGKDQAMVRVSSIVPFIIMKSQALNDRLKEKDAYDIYYCLMNYPDGLDALAEEFHSFLQYPQVLEGLDILAKKYLSPGHVGAAFVTDFLEITDPESRDLVRRDAYERVNYLLRKIGIIK